MNKFTKISLLTALSLASVSSSALAANSLTDAFSNGKTKGALKSYYFIRNYDQSTTKDASIWVNGGYLNYVTDDFKGLKLGATLQTTHVGSIDDDSSKFSGTMDASGSILSESYIEYKFNNTIFKGGRQYINLPLINGSGSRMIKESFEGYFLTNTDIPDTIVSLGKVTKYARRTDGVGDTGKFLNAKTGDHGTISLYIKNNSIKNLDLQVQYIHKSESNNSNDGVKVLYLASQYTIDSALKPFIAAQYFDSNYENNTTKDSSMYGFKTGITISDVNLLAGYTRTNDDGNVFHGIGENAYSSYTSSFVSSSPAYKAGTNTWLLSAGYNFGKLGTKLTYSSFNNPIDTADLKQTSLNLRYKITKNLNTFVDYSILDYGNNTNDYADIRLGMVYSF